MVSNAGVVQTQERLDRAWAWIAAAEALFARRLGDAPLDGGVFLMGECGDVLVALEAAGAQPQSVDVDPVTGPATVTAAGCLGRAEAELDAVAAADRPTLLLPARAQLRAVVVRIPVDQWTS